MESNSLSGRLIVIISIAGAINRRFVHGIAERGGFAMVVDINLDASKNL